MSRVLEKKQSATKLSDARISPLAGKPAPREMLVDLARLEKEYFDRKPDLEGCQPVGCVWNKRPPWDISKRHVH